MTMGRSDAGKSTYTRGERREKLIMASLYRKNALPYGLVLLSILFELAYVVTILDNMQVDHMMGLVVFADIVILFLLFVCAVKMNVYSLFWSWAAFALCAVFALRAAFFIPLVLRPLHKQAEILMCNVAAALLTFLAGAVSLSVIRKRRRIRPVKGQGEVKP